MFRLLKRIETSGFPKLRLDSKKNWRFTMFTKKLLIFLAVVAVTTMSCGLTVDLPITTEIKTGATRTEELKVPDPGSSDDPLNVSIAFGAGELSIEPGAELLIEGTATYNVSDFRPELESSDDRVELSSGNLEIEGFPKFDDRIINEWELSLSDRPMDLKVFAGAYSGDFELGGLSLTSLRIADGAAEVHVNFDQLNQVVMENFRYETGASSVVLTNLGNANFRSMAFQGGAGSYELDFSGQLQDDANVRIQTGLSELTVVVPDELDVSVRIEGGLTNVNTSGGWGQSGGYYTNDGDGPALEIIIKIGAGNLSLYSR
jgi:hypothetical protein